MPGHKGRVPPGGEFLGWASDITEIAAMREAPDPVRRSEALMAETYGADRTWYSVQGATLPVMAAILAANPPGSPLFVDRAMHRSVLGALIIGGYRVRWMYPEILSSGLTLPLVDSPSDLEGFRSLVLTRPTYDGIAADIHSMVAAAHQRGLTVVVDEAHGSHYSGAYFPRSALSYDADLVAHGVHKNEASLTQTGLLHLKGGRVNPLEVEMWWRLLGTSSPSYLLLGALDRLQAERHEETWRRKWEEFAASALYLQDRLGERGVETLQHWARSQGYQADPSRLTLLAPGEETVRNLLPWGEVEKVTPESVTLILSPGDDLDRLLAVIPEAVPTHQSLRPQRIRFPRLSTALTAREAWGAPGRLVPLWEAQGCALKEALTPYPPGMPLAVPGEVLNQSMLEWIREWQSRVTAPIEGISIRQGRSWVWVIDW